MNCVRLVNREHRLEADESRWTRELVWIDENTQLQPVCARALNDWITHCGRGSGSDVRQRLAQL